MLLDDDSVRPEAFTELVSDESAESSTNGGGVASSSASSGKSSNKKGKNKPAKSGKGNSPAKESGKKNKRNSGPLAGLLLVLSIASDGSCKVKTASGDSGNNSDTSTSISGDDDERSHAPPVQVRTFGKLFTTSVV
jgi:hypothetical protein